MIGSTCSIGAPTMLARSTLERSSNRTPTSNTKEILILVRPMHGMFDNIYASQGKNLFTEKFKNSAYLL